MKTVSYIRASKYEHEQKQLLEELAAEKGFTITDHFIDIGFSADGKKPEFSNILKMMNDGEKITILTVSVDRFYRDSVEFAKFIRDVIEKECRVVCFKNDFDTADPSKQAVIEVLATIDELQRAE